MEKQVIKKSELIKLQEQGMKRQEIADKYEVSLQEMNKYFKTLGIKTKVKKVTKYEVQDDTIPVKAQEIV